MAASSPRVNPKMTDGRVKQQAGMSAGLVHIDYSPDGRC